MLFRVRGSPIPQSCNCVLSLVTIPIELAAITIHVAVVAAQFAVFVSRSNVVIALKIAAILVAIPRDSDLIVSYISALAP